VTKPRHITLRNDALPIPADIRALLGGRGTQYGILWQLLARVGMKVQPTVEPRAGQHPGAGGLPTAWARSHSARWRVGRPLTL
jgi:hypothetical protein